MRGRARAARRSHKPQAAGASPAPATSLAPARLCSPTDQRVFSELRQSGIEYNSVQGQMIAEQIRFNDQLKETQQIAGEALKGFLSDLRNGVSASKALDNALARIGDRLAEKALDQLTGGLLGGKGFNIGLPANDNGAGGGFFDRIGDAIAGSF